MARIQTDAEEPVSSPDHLNHIAELLDWSAIVVAGPSRVLQQEASRRWGLSAPLKCFRDSLSDPGNLGTLMRASLAAGADGLLLSPGSVDPFSPKVLRSGMGAHFKLPLQIADWTEIATLTQDLTLLLADMTSGASLWDTDLTGPVGIILGSEAHGPGAEARR